MGVPHFRLNNTQLNLVIMLKFISKVMLIKSVSYFILMFGKRHQLALLVGMATILLDGVLLRMAVAWKIEFLECFYFTWLCTYGQS